MPAVRLKTEQLEDRHCPSGGHLLVADFGGDKVLRYDGDTGAFVDTFVPRHAGGLNHPYGVVIGPRDGDLYVSTGSVGGPGQLKAVLRYDGDTGVFREEFTEGGDLQTPVGIIFGPDGNLYVGTGTGGLGGRVARYDGATGSFLGDFVPPGGGGLRGPTGLVFGPDGTPPGGLDLYVCSAITNSVLRYDGATGTPLGEFVTGGRGGLGSPRGLVFGPDGNLYVASSGIGVATPPAVLRFQGPSGPAPGEYIDSFIPAGRGGLQTPIGLIFGPDGNGDGRLDLYATNSDVKGNSINGKKATVKRYDGVTGAFIDTFVSKGSGGLDDAQFLTFTETDPVTLAYTGERSSVRVAAASLVPAPAVEAPPAPAVRPDRFTRPAAAEVGAAPAVPRTTSPARPVFEPDRAPNDAPGVVPWGVVLDAADPLDLPT